MGVNLSEFKKNIISWYPIKQENTVLQIGENEEITTELLRKTKNVVVSNNLNEFEIKAKFDYIVLIGIFEDVKIEEAIEIFKTSKKLLERNGKILLAMKNKFGMKYWAGEKFAKGYLPFESIKKTNENILGYSKIKRILDDLDLKYKFYYPLPDYELTNVVYTDKFLPTKDSIDSRVLTFCDEDELLSFSEREVYKELIENDIELFPFFSNSYFIEIAEKERFSDVRFVSFGLTRKKEYRIKTIITEDRVYKYADNEDAQKHIENINNNLEVLKTAKITYIGKKVNDYIETEFLKDAKSYDQVLIDIYEKNGFEAVIKEITNFKENILNNLLYSKSLDTTNTVFEKYDVKISRILKEKLNFVQNGLIDLIFQNCLVKKDKIYAYDQEWFEENVPIEFILYRNVLYFTELRNNEDFEKILERLNLVKFKEVFEELENKIQERLLDQDVWKMHVESVGRIASAKELSNNYEARLNAANEHIENLENNIEEYKQGIEDLTALIQSKDVELVNYANQLRAISGSLSWKLTKPIRILSWVLNPKSGASFIDRIMPPGGRRRAEYDKKQTEKKYAKKVENYFKLSDKETAEYWKGIDHRLFLKYEKNIEREKENEFSDYEKYIKSNSLTDQEIEKQTKIKFKRKPKISIIVPLYNTDTEFFRELLYTVHCQTYKNWELCLVDGSEKPLEEIKSMVEKDKRIKYKFLGENKGISGNTNEALKMATGDFISLLDHDDILEITALFEIVKVINENPDVDFIYTDEDKFHFIDEPYFAPHFKPDYAPDTLRANNYICHYSVIRKDLLEKVGGFRSEFDGAQDFDLILRISENAKRMFHIPKILYHWRIHKDSTAMNQEAKPYAIIAGRKAIESHLERIGLKGKVFEGPNAGTYGIDYEVNGNPKVSIVIPNKDGQEILETCINSILEKTKYSNYEIVIVENNSEKEEIFEYYKELEKNEKIKVLYYPEKGFNYSKIINFGVRNSNGEFVIQLNNDTEVLTPNWIEKMLGYCQREDVGAVGAKLYYPDETIQHAGIMVGVRTVAAHMFRGLAKDEQGYFGRENLTQNMNAVTAACIMTKKSIYEEVGFMNEEFAVAFNDIDFCLKIRKTGKLIVYNPFVEFVHYESKTRGDDNTPENLERFQGEINLFLETWKEKLAEGDEYYNKNLSLETEYYDVRTDKV